MSRIFIIRLILLMRKKDATECKITETPAVDFIDRRFILRYTELIDYFISERM